MKTLRQMLASKSGPLASVTPDTPVFRALQVMSDANVGALLVLDGPKLVGIFSERDYARKVILRGKASRDTRCARS
jgi:CBS domain-containing protein